MGFKISPRAIGFSAGLQLPFSIILALRSRAESRTIRARRNNPGGLFRCFVRGRAKAAPEMRIPTRRADYRLGSLYSLLTAVLVATQEPFLRRDNQDENRPTIRMRIRRRGDIEGRA
jgi:hypothetical protein